LRSFLFMFQDTIDMEGIKEETDYPDGTM